jgi:uncharacterized DUF497 family protein
MNAVDSVIGLNRDEGNLRKNEKYGATQAEAAEVFLHRPLAHAPGVAHSAASEPRVQALGVTRTGRRPHLTFAIRGSAADATSPNARMPAAARSTPHGLGPDQCDNRRKTKRPVQGGAFRLLRL